MPLPILLYPILKDSIGSHGHCVYGMIIVMILDIGLQCRQNNLALASCCISMH